MPRIHRQSCLMVTRVAILALVFITRKLASAFTARPFPPPLLLPSSSYSSTVQNTAAANLGLRQGWRRASPPSPSRKKSTSSAWLCSSSSVGQGGWPWGEEGKLPPAIFCIGLNYRAHATELGKTLPTEPVVFSKSPACMVPPGGEIVLPSVEECVDYEGELVVVIGDRAVKDVSANDALGYVKGYCVANDVSGRSWQFDRPNGGQWVRSKNFDTFFPISPMIPASDITDPQSLTIRTTINGELVQDGATADMIFTVADIIEFLSISSTLLPGTLISTGTPVGVGYTSNPKRYLRDGDVVRIQIEGVGEVENKVRQG